MEDQITNLRMAALEARMASLEQRLATLEQSSTAAKPKKRKDLSPEDRAAIRARLVAGQEKARARREAEAKAQAKVNKKKEAGHGTSEEKR